MKNRRKLYAILLFVIFFTGCKPEIARSITKGGNDISWERPDKITQNAAPYIDTTLNNKAESYSINLQGDPSIIKLVIDAAKIDTAGMSVSAHTIFPAVKILANKTLTKSAVYFNLKVQSPHYCDLYLNGSKTRLFVLPNDTLTLKYSGDSQVYSGKTANVNNYLREKEKSLNIKDNISAKGMLSHTSPDLATYKRRNNEITALEFKFLAENKEKFKLPKVFVDFEKAELEYFSAHKINTPGYRRDMMKIKEEVPADYYDFLDSVPINNPNAIFSGYYWQYLMLLADHYFYTDAMSKLSIPERLKALYPLELDFFDKKLAQPLRDYAYTYLLTMSIDLKYIKDESFYLKYADKLEDRNAKEIILSSLLKAKKKALTPGTMAPNFHLLSTDGELKSLKDYQGKVIYLSFWANWCKPCIMEFPNENKLMDKFEGKDFVVINVCKASPQKSWLTLIEKHNLKTENLFANSSWNSILDNGYDIFSLPHYVLIDKEGKVVENKTSRPAEPELIEKIKALL